MAEVLSRSSFKVLFKYLFYIKVLSLRSKILFVPFDTCTPFMDDIQLIFPTPHSYKIPTQKQPN